MNAHATGPDIVVQSAGTMVPGGVVISAKTAAGRAWMDANQHPDVPRNPDYMAVALARAALPLLEQAKRRGLVVHTMARAVATPWTKPTVDASGAEELAAACSMFLWWAVCNWGVRWHLDNHPAPLPPELAAALVAAGPRAMRTAGVDADHADARQRCMARVEHLRRATRAVWGLLTAHTRGARDRSAQVPPHVERAWTAYVDADCAHRELAQWWVEHDAMVDALFNPEGTS